MESKNRAILDLCGSLALLVVLCGFLIWLTGCAGLLLRETDTPDERTGKITARVLLAIPTVLTSEIVMEMVRSHEEHLARMERYKTADMETLEDLVRYPPPGAVSDGDNLWMPPITLGPPGVRVVPFGYGVPPPGYGQPFMGGYGQRYP